MWNKFFASKIEKTVDSLVLKKLNEPLKTNLALELEEAKNQALKKIVKKEVKNSLLKYFNKEVYEQTEKAIAAFNSTLQQELKTSGDEKETKKLVFDKVFEMYPKANIYRHMYAGFYFRMPELDANVIIDGLTDTIIAEIAEMD